MPVIKIRGEDGKFYKLPTVKGDKGEPGNLDEKQIAELKKEILDEVKKMIEEIKQSS